MSQVHTTSDTPSGGTMDINLSMLSEKQLQHIATTIGINVAICQKEILNLDEAALYTGMKKSYLYKLTSMKMIPHYKPAGKYCFFRRTELEEWLTANPVATVADLNAAAQAYCMKNKR